MRTKTYTCSDDNDININLETNQIPNTIRACVNNLKQDIGWKVPHRSTVGVQIHKGTLTQGFYPTFSQEHAMPKFVDDMFDANIRRKTSLLRSMCFEHNNEIKAINPLWAGDYDVTSCPLGLACGCDTHVQEVRFVDVRCATKSGQECRDNFPEFDDILQNRIPEYCLRRGEMQEPVVMLQNGALRATEIPLCSMDSNTSKYTAACGALDGTLFGGLNGWRGQTADDLHSNSQTPDIYMPGLYNSSNSIFRRTKFTPSMLPVLQVFESDIGGHALHFKLQSNSFRGDDLYLESVLLETRPSESKNSATEKNWLQNLEFKWQWQHARLFEVWPELDTNPAPRMSWQCPLQWISAYSDRSKTFAARVPNAYRNRMRFKHITGANEFAHPTVQSIAKMQNLIPAYYKADHIMVARNKDTVDRQHGRNCVCIYQHYRRYRR